MGLWYYSLKQSLKHFLQAAFKPSGATHTSRLLTWPARSPRQIVQCHGRKHLSTGTAKTPLDRGPRYCWLLPQQRVCKEKGSEEAPALVPAAGRMLLCRGQCPVPAESFPCTASRPCGTRGRAPGTSRLGWEGRRATQNYKRLQKPKEQSSVN